MSQWIYVDLDGKQFGRVRLEYTETVAQLRTVLIKNYRLPPNNCFLDSEGYRVARADEDTDNIESLLVKNNVIIMRSIEVTPERTTSSNTSDTQKGGRTVFDGFGKLIIRELLSILGWLWYIVLKLMIVLVLVISILYYGYTKLLCHHGRFLPLVTMYCPVDPFESISLPPVSELAEKSASLAETLMNTDVSAPMRLVQAKTSLIQLRSQVIYSDIDVSVRDKLSQQMGELQKLVQTGADQLTTMLTSFGGTLDKVRLYTQFAIEDLSKVIHAGIHRSNTQLQLGYSEMEARKMLTKSFDDYILSISKQIDQILFKAQQASMSLELIREKLETIQETSFKGRYISQTRIDQLKHGAFWSRLFDEGKLGIVKHQRNLQTLDRFIDFVTAASTNVNDIVIKLKLFKTDADGLKQTTSDLERLPHISISRHAQLLEAALKRLTQSKKKFEGKLENANQDNELY